MSGFNYIPRPDDGAVWITGASAGIGRAVALKMAEDGWTVFATARNAEKLDELSKLHPNIEALPGDVTDAEGMAHVVAEILRRGPLALALLNAGVYTPMRAPEYDAKAAADTFAVNLTGVSNCLAPVMAHFWRERRGCIAMVASVAGYRGLPRAAPYGATKAGLIAMAEALAFDLAPRGVRISVINPGFVRTDATAVNEFKMPFLMEADAAANRIVAGLKKPGFEIAFPRRFVVILKALGFLRPRSYFWAMRKMLGWDKVIRQDDR